MLWRLRRSWNGCWKRRLRPLFRRLRPLPLAGGEDGAVTTVTFAERDGKTLLVLHELYPSKEALDAGLASGAYDGMNEALEQLDELLATLASR